MTVSDPRAGRRTVRSSSADAARRKPPLVLLAEDNAVNQKVAAAMLGKLGYSCDIAADGREAVDAVRSARYDAVLMDCQMPRLDGYAATARIREHEDEHEHEGTHVPIIAMTASAMQGDMERCLAAGMDDYLPKPVELPTLEAVLRRWIRAPGQGNAPLDAAPSPGGPAGLFDQKRVAQLRALRMGSEGDGFAVLAGRLLSDAQEMMSALHEAVSRLDSTAAIQHLHKLRGGAATIGAVRLAGLCGDLEEAIEAGAPLPDHEALVRIEDELGHIRAALP